VLRVLGHDEHERLDGLLLVVLGEHLQLDLGFLMPESVT